MTRRLPLDLSKGSATMQRGPIFSFPLRSDGFSQSATCLHIYIYIYTTVCSCRKEMSSAVGCVLVFFSPSFPILLLLHLGPLFPHHPWPNSLTVKCLENHTMVALLTPRNQPQQKTKNMGCPCLGLAGSQSTFGGALIPHSSTGLDSYGVNSRAELRCPAAMGKKGHPFFVG